MPIFYQQDIDDNTKLAIWKIEENEDFFLQHVPLQREITHPHKRLQHLAGRYLLLYLFPDFPVSLIKIADTRKPFLEDEAYHFSISHCGHYAAAIVSRDKRVGVDIEVPTHRVEKIKHKFLSQEEIEMLNGQLAVGSGQLTNHSNEQVEELMNKLTLLWSFKEAMFKWWSLGDVDFRTMLHVSFSQQAKSVGALQGRFTKEELEIELPLFWKIFPGLLLAWVVTLPDNQKVAAASATPSQ